MANSERFQISEEKFQVFLQHRMGDQWEKALKLFKDYGPHLSLDVANVFDHAVRQGKIDLVMERLQEHYNNHLHFQHPDIRGTVKDELMEVNPTQAMFIRLCTVDLKLQPASA